MKASNGGGWWRSGPTHPGDGEASGHCPDPTSWKMPEDLLSMVKSWLSRDLPGCTSEGPVKHLLSLRLNCPTAPQVCTLEVDEKPWMKRPRTRQLVEMFSVSPGDWVWSVPWKFSSFLHRWDQNCSLWSRMASLHQTQAERETRVTSCSEETTLICKYRHSDLWCEDAGRQGNRS